GVHLRVQGLDAAVEALGKAGELLDLHDRDARVGDAGGGRARRDDLHAGLVKALGEPFETGLVVDADQRPLDRDAGHPILTFLFSMVHRSRTIRPTVRRSRGRSTALIRSCSDSSSSSSRTGTASWATIGPVSTPASTKCAVQPATFTPYSSASRAPFVPGND